MKIGSFNCYLGSLWKECNRRICKDKKLDWQKLVNKIKASIMETVKYRISKTSIKSLQMAYWDKKMRGIWIGLKILPFTRTRNSNKKKSREACYWAKLNSDIYMVN